MSMRIKVFMIAVFIIVVGQVIYSNQNVDSFQESYINTLQNKSRKLGGYLKDEVERILNKGIQITKLIRMEQTLKQILYAIPELEFIEITDKKGFVLYYADHGSMGRVPQGERKSKTLSQTSNARLEELGLQAMDIDIRIPVYQKKKEHVGNIIMRLSPELIVGKSHEILLDMITVILTSLLITFELMTFFVAYSISFPLDRVTREVDKATKSLLPLSSENFLFMIELRIVIDRFNEYIRKFARSVGPIISVQEFFPELEKKINTTISTCENNIQEISSSAGIKRSKEMKGHLESLDQLLQGIKKHILAFRARLSLDIFSPMKSEASVSASDPRIHLPYSYIRPLIFLFVMADSFSASFFPLFVDTMYEPLFGLSQKVVLGLPISVYMFSFGISMLLFGGVLDTFGWLKPLLIGIFITGAGLALTATCNNIMYLILIRFITAMGFGLVFLACQRFVIDSTSKQERTHGMASFIAAYFSGNICGTVIGGMLADRIGYGNVFYVASAVCLFAFLFALIVFKEEMGPRNEEVHKASFRQLFMALRDPEFSTVVFLQAIPSKMILIGFLTYLVPLYLKSIGTLQSNIGRVVMCYGIALVFFGPMFSRFFDKVAHRKYYIFIGGLITGFSMLSYYFHQGFASIFILVVLMGVAHTFSVSPQTSLISETRVVKSMGAGTGIGMFRFWERIGNVAGPIVVGLMVSGMGYEQSVVGLGIISLCFSLAYIIVIQRLKPEHPPVS